MCKTRGKSKELWDGSERRWKSYLHTRESLLNLLASLAFIILTYKPIPAPDSGASPDPVRGGVRGSSAWPAHCVLGLAEAPFEPTPGGKGESQAGLHTSISLAETAAEHPSRSEGGLTQKGLESVQNSWHWIGTFQTPQKYLDISTSFLLTLQFNRTVWPSSSDYLFWQTRVVCQRYIRTAHLVVCVPMLSCVCLAATLWAVVHQAPLSMKFSSQESWSVLPFPPPGDLPNPGTEIQTPVSPALPADFTS